MAFIAILSFDFANKGDRGEDSVAPKRKEIRELLKNKGWTEADRSAFVFHSAEAESDSASQKKILAGIEHVLRSSGFFGKIKNLNLQVQFLKSRL